MKIRVATWTAALVVLSIAAFAQGPRRDGKWEVKMEMDMPGMPVGMPPMTSTQCIKPSDASDPQKLMPQGRGGRGSNPNDCKMSDFKADGNKTSWTMKCEGQTPMTGTGEFIYGADSYTGVMKMDMGGRSMTMKYTGKRLGDCTQ